MLWFIIYQTISISFHIDGFFMFIKVQKYENYYIPPSFHRHFQPKKSPSKPGNVELRYFLHFSNTKSPHFLHFSNKTIGSNHPSRRQFQPVPNKQGDEE